MAYTYNFYVIDYSKWTTYMNMYGNKTWKRINNFLLNYAF